MYSMLYRSSHPGKAWTALPALILLTCASGAAAQDPEADQATPENLGTLQITGSRIKRTDYETASPIQVISREDIEASGKLSVADVLRGISADSQGSIPMAFSGGFAAGSSAVSLRGLGVNSTLVLLNGRRMAPYGLADDGSHVFVDLNTIPLEAVERIDILKDGSSAIYGSDAVGGVVNVILRSDYQGATVAISSGTSYRGDGDSYRLAGAFGHGDLYRDGYNGFLSFEAYGSDAIGNADRGGHLGTNDLRRFGWYDNRVGAAGAGFGELYGLGQGGWLASRNLPYGAVAYQGDPAEQLSPYQATNLTPCVEVSAQTGNCLWDPIDFEQIQPKEDHLNVLARGTFRLADSIRAYAEAAYFRTEMEAVGTPSGFTFGGTYNPGNPANPLFPTMRPVLPAGHPDNPYDSDLSLRYSAVDAGGRNQTTENEVTRYLIGIEGSLSAWNYDVGALYTESKLDNRNYGFPQLDPLQAALDDGSYRINNRAAVEPEVYTAIFPVLRNKPETSVSVVDATVSGPVFELPGGSLSIAVGTEWRNEQADSPPVPGTDNGQVAGLGYSAFNSDRDVYAGYLEIEAPIIPMLTASAAVRYDHYSDYGSSTTPKFGLKFKPMDWLALRGTYSEAFRAPGPTESGDSASLGFTNIAIVSIGDASVKPEEAKSYTVGLVAQPLPDTSITIDYYRIERENEIVQADQAAILGDNPVSGGPEYADAIVAGEQPNSFIYYDEEGNLSAIAGPYANANQTRTSGFDIDFSQAFRLGDWGRLTAGLTLTHIISLERKLEDGTSYEYAGTHGPYVLSSASGTPQDRATVNLTWERSIVSVTATINYVGSMTMIDHEGESLQEITTGYFATTTYEAPGFGYAVQPGEPVCGVYSPDGTAPGNCELPSFTTLDLFGKVRVGSNWEVTGAIANALDKMAPFDPYTYGGVNYNVAFHQSGAIGRYFTLGARYRF